jgi:hypothetical protein
MAAFEDFGAFLSGPLNIAADTLNGLATDEEKCHNS